jgi:beta-1,4-mannosyltransferase
MTRHADGIRVLFSFEKPSERSNPYVELLANSLRGKARFRYFSWSVAIFGRYDVLHVHWPETLLRGRDLPRRLVRSVLMVVFLLRILLWRTAVVRTLHNVSPHESGNRTERWLLAALDRLTSTWIVMNSDESVSALELPEDRVFLVPHGHFREWYRREDRPVAEAGRFLLFGQLRPYKGVEDLIAAFAEVPDSVGASLELAGMPVNADFAEEIRLAAQHVPRVNLRLSFLSDSELVRAILAAQIVVLPYRRMLNSGAALTALSLNRPVLVPRSETNIALAEETGEQWVQLFDWPLTSEDLVKALENSRARPVEAEPDLSKRTWEAAGARHVDAYVEAVRRPRRRIGQ